MNGLQAAVFGGSAMILLVLALRLLFGKHLPRRLFPALWCAAALRLLLPVEIPTSFSVWNLLRVPRAAQTGGMISNALTPFPVFAGGGAAEQAADAARISPILLVWGVISALLAAYFVAGYVLLVRRFRMSPLAPQPSVDALLARLQLSRRLRICRTENRRAPLTFGVLRPTVLLPENLDARSDAFLLVLAHELAHVRRRDCLRKLLMMVCLCLYWWHPLVWLMVRLADRDMELACDEAVLRTLGPDCKKLYAATLLDLAQRPCAPAPLCSGFARSCVEERIRAILRFRRGPAWTGVCAAMFFALSASVFATQATLPVKSADTAVVHEEEHVSEAQEPRVRFLEAELVPPEVEAPRYVWPLEDADAAVTDGYGAREHPIFHTTSFHSGVDLDAAEGANVLAVADGTVVSCEFDEAYGYLLTLAHADGVRTQYAHLQEFLVQPGDAVAQGQVVALAGSSGWSTGPHLHLQVLVDGETVDPLAALGGEP